MTALPSWCEWRFEEPRLELAWYPFAMLTSLREHKFDDLVAAITDSDDPLLYERACRALAALLSADDIDDRFACS